MRLPSYLVAARNALAALELDVLFYLSEDRAVTAEFARAFEYMVGQTLAPL